MNIPVELLQEHDYQDIYRLEPGFNLVVNKFVRHPVYINPYYAPYKGLSAKHANLRHCVALTVDITDPHTGDTHPAGTIILDCAVIEPTSDPSKYWYELKVGTNFTGTADHMLRLTNKIQGIIAQYR